METSRLIWASSCVVSIRRLLTTFIATLCPVQASRAWYTLAKAPHPNSLPISYFSNSSFLLLHGLPYEVEEAAVVVVVEVEVEVEEEGSSWISGMVSRDRRIVGLVWDFQSDLHQICQIKSK